MHPDSLPVVVLVMDGSGVKNILLPKIRKNKDAQGQTQPWVAKSSLAVMAKAIVDERSSRASANPHESIASAPPRRGWQEMKLGTGGFSITVPSGVWSGGFTGEEDSKLYICAQYCSCARLLVLPSSGGCLGLSPIREQYEHMQSDVLLASSALVAFIGEKSCTGDRGRSEGCIDSEASTGFYHRT